MRVNGIDTFILKGKQGHLDVKLEEVYGFPNQTSHFGGYDVRGCIEIKSSNYFVKGELWFSTGEVYTFYEQLKIAYDNITGEVTFRGSEANLEIRITFNRQGHVLFTGYYQEQAYLQNELKFEIESDQSFIEETLKDLEKFVQKYGGVAGR